MIFKSNIIVKYTNGRIIPARGLAVVGALLGKSNFTKNLTRWILLRTVPSARLIMEILSLNSSATMHGQTVL